MLEFTETKPSLESYWRSIILFGRNVASYKFALAKSLLHFSEQGKSFVPLEELAVPFARHVAEHIRDNDRQGTSASSKFLNACRAFNAGQISVDTLASRTVQLGFNNVIDAFHVVNQGEIPVRFFDDQRSGATKGISLCDELLRLRQSVQFGNLPHEVESRWRLVETAWSLGVARRPLEVEYISEEGLLWSRHLRRPAITSCRDALNGYQKGKCFFCFNDISVEAESDSLADVDHFFPRVLQFSGVKANLDGVWNLVLACKRCNRGEDGKFARVPLVRLLARLQKRNDFLIESHHPLRETLMSQTGPSEASRHDFLQRMDAWAINTLVHRWAPEEELEAHF